MRFVNIKLKLLHFMMKIMKILYSLLIKNDEIIYLINLMLNMFKIINNVNVIKILNFKKNKYVFNESQMLK